MRGRAPTGGSAQLVFPAKAGTPLFFFWPGFWCNNPSERASKQKRGPRFRGDDG